MSAPTQIVNESKRQNSGNLIAHFKAKCGVSNRSIANLLNINPQEAKVSLDGDMFTAEQNRLVNEVQAIIDHMIEEAELLQEHSPFLILIQHEKDMQELEIKSLRKLNAGIKARISRLENMSFFKRLIFLFKGNK